ncbi:sulfotransferase [Flavilitoribacter nigricans]|uniref:Sulfotransferase family protein n=1 Tax=Flavilitoribacter nigricans (strain ATCC 23147 / DSM 23189 / NBRC 102662 / NCIMB 1420 / SS-2) TaxID=1122177 RepID=A0A2D0ND86_FLAN2|nr:sulfotransferase [Flavilitoribacter nigricans]PHN06445.1 hypothetical protein CRP01_12825 [Flavilitoribacter nigricans DSM 23189 = NBRC 102662]
MSDSTLKEKLARLLFPAYKNYAPTVFHNKLRSFLSSRSEHKFLFILSPPYCGSTLLNELISTSRAVSVNNAYGSREGQTLPTVRAIMFDHQDRWNASHDFDWKKIKREWMKYWDLTYPVLLEKSPPNLVRAESISKVFDPAFFIIFYRNPYAHCESLMRRNKVTPQNAANFALKSLRHQRDNKEHLENAIVISYEMLTTEPERAVALLASHIPELKDIDINRSFSAHNFQKQEKMKIKNLNQAKLENLSREDIHAINGIFEKQQELLTYFGYQMLEP